MVSFWIPEALEKIESFWGDVPVECINGARDAINKCRGRTDKPMPEITLFQDGILIEWPDIRKRIFIFPDGHALLHISGLTL